jgi:DNA-damage-inducible protein J
MTMTKTVTVQARMEPKLKEQADAILASLGINATTAITLFYTQMVRHRGIPLELKVPNEELLAAIAETKDPEFRKSAKRFDTVADLMADLNS